MEGNNETIKILYELSINADKYIQDVQTLSVELRNAQAELKKVKEASGDNSIEFRKQEVVVGNLSKAFTDAKNTAKAMGIVMDENASSYQKATAAVKVLGNDMKTVEGATQDNIDATKTLNSTLQDMQAETGKGTLRVGMYKEALAGLIPGIEGLKIKLEALRASSEKLNLGSAEFKKVQEEIKQTQFELGKASGRYDEFGNRLTKRGPAQAMFELQHAVTGVVAGTELMKMAFGDETDGTKKAQQAIEALTVVTLISHAMKGAGALLQMAENTQLKINTLLKGENSSMTAISTAFKGADTVATGILTVATMALNAAVKALMGPLGWILGIGGALIGLFMAWTSESDKNKAANERLTASMEEQNEKMKDYETLSKKQIEVMKLKGATLEEVYNKEKELGDTETGMIKEKIATQEEIVRTSSKKELEAAKKHLNELKQELVIHNLDMIELTIKFNDEYNKTQESDFQKNIKHQEDVMKYQLELRKTLGMKESEALQKELDDKLKLQKKYLNHIENDEQLGIEKSKEQKEQEKNDTEKFTQDIELLKAKIQANQQKEWEEANKKAAENRKKIHEEEVRVANERIKSAEELMKSELDILTKGSDEYIAKQIEWNNKVYQLRIEAALLEGKDTCAIEEENQNAIIKAKADGLKEIKKLLIEALKKEAELKLKGDEESLKELDELHKTKLSSIKRFSEAYLQLELEFAEKERQAKIAIAEDNEKKDVAGGKDPVKAAFDTNTAIAAINQEAANKVTGIWKAQADNQMAEMNKIAQATKGYADKALSYISQSDKIALNNKIKGYDDDLAAHKITQAEHDQLTKDAKTNEAKQEKDLKIFQIIINTAAAVISALSTSNIPLAIADGVEGAIQLGIAESTPIPAFAIGGHTGRGTPGKDDRTIKVSGEEYVLNPNAVKAIGVERLNQINFSQFPAKFAVGGYTGFANGGFAGFNSKGYANGGIIADVSQPIKDSFDNVNALAFLVKMMPAPIVGVRDIIGAQASQNNIVQLTTF